MAKRKTLLLVLSIIGTLALFGQVAQAGGSSQGDDYGNNRDPYIGYNPKSPGPNQGCDTLDPVLTQNRQLVAYKCISFPGAPGIPAENGVANLTSFSMDSNTPGMLHMQWVTQGPIPTPGADTLFEGVHGFSFSAYFQNANRQNARQRVGNTLDCARYAHMGPYLTGNSEYLNVFYNIVFNDGIWVQEIGWGHYDPVGASAFNWAFIADGSQQRRADCSGSLPSSSLVPFPGTGHSAQVNGNTLDLYVPMQFSWVDNQLNMLTYTLAQPGDTITKISAQVASDVDVATTPPVCVSGTPVCQSQQGVSSQILLDWIPWGSFDLGLATVASALPGPSCPAFNALEYQPGGGKNSTGGTYLPLGKGPAGQDRDTQANPLYGAPNGLNHYDASGQAGSTLNDIRPQDHFGPTGCNIDAPEAAGFTGSGGSFTV